MSQGRKLDPRAFAIRCVGSFFACLQELLKDELNIAHVMGQHLMGLVGVLLRQNKLAVLGVDALLALQSLLERASPKAEFVRAVCKQLLFDFDLWRNSDFSVRIGHVQVVATLLRDHAGFFRHTYGVQFMLDVLRSSTGPVNGGNESSENAAPGLPPAAPTNTLKRKLGHKRTPSYGVAGREGSGSFGRAMEEERDMRASVLNLIRHYFETGATDAEARALVVFLLTCEDNLILEEMLVSILSALKAGVEGSSVGATFHAALTCNGPPTLLYGLLQRANSRLRAGKEFGE